MTYKNILLNCVLLNAVFCYSANAYWIDTDTGWHDGVELDIGSGQSITLDGMNLTSLTMANTSSLILNNGGYVDDATFSGSISDSASAINDFALTLFTTKTTFSNVDVAGSYNPNKSVITWGDQTSFWTNELVLTGNVSMDTVQVGMSSD